MKDDKETLQDEVIDAFGNNVNTSNEGEIKIGSNDEVPSQDLIKELENQIAEYKDKYLRLFAEFDNYKKRTSREILDIRATASKETMVSMLPILDDFNRAKKAADEGVDSEKFSEGVNLVYQKFLSTLESKGLKVIESNGVEFNAEWHEAITEIPAPTDEMKGKIIDTVESGYTLNDRIIRYPKVVVGK